MDSQIPKTSKFYKVYANLGMHMNPDVVKKEYQKYINTDDLNTKNLKKYFEILSSISFVLNKLLKYKIYFTEFYPNTKNIKNYEALEYHIHAYLEDIDILRNKVCWYAGMLKNDLKQLATNKEEI